MRAWVYVAALAALGTVGPRPASAAPAGVGRVTGIGGIFVISKHPKALATWYRDVLGIALQPWGGATFRSDAPGHPPVELWTAFPSGATEFAHSRRDFMVNFAVDNLDALLARLRAKGVRIIDRETDAFGKFASILDPDGTKIELWQPKKR